MSLILVGVPDAADVQPDPKGAPSDGMCLMIMITIIITVQRSSKVTYLYCTAHATVHANSSKNGTVTVEYNTANCTYAYCSCIFV